jgi:hypothetical protein
MTAGEQSAGPQARKTLKLHVYAFACSVALSLLVAGPAQESRLEAALLLVVASGLVLDAWSLRIDNATLVAANATPARWIPRLGMLAYALGGLLMVYALIFLWHPRRRIETSSTRYPSCTRYRDGVGPQYSAPQA